MERGTAQEIPPSVSHSFPSVWTTKNGFQSKMSKIVTIARGTASAREVRQEENRSAASSSWLSIEYDDVEVRRRRPSHQRMSQELRTPRDQLEDPLVRISRLAEAVWPAASKKIISRTVADHPDTDTAAAAAATAKNNLQRRIITAWVAEQTHVLGVEWSPVRSLAAYLYSTQKAFWGTPRERTGPRICSFLKSKDSCRIFKVRRVVTDDGIQTDLICLDEDALHWAASRAAMGLLPPPSWRPRSEEGEGAKSARTDSGRRCNRDEDVDTSGGSDDADVDDADAGDVEDEHAFTGGITVATSLLARVRELVDAVWPPTSDPALATVRVIRRFVAERLVTNGATNRNRACPMTRIGRCLRQHLALHNNAVATRGFRNLSGILRDSDSHGVFQFCRNEQNNADAVYLDFRILQAAASGSSAGDGTSDTVAAAAAAPTPREGEDRSDRQRGDGSLLQGSQQTQSRIQEPGTGVLVPLDGQMLEAALARVCDSSLRGRCWRQAASVLAAIPNGPYGPRSLASVDLLDEIRLLNPDLVNEAANFCGGRIRLRDLISGPVGIQGGGSGSASTSGSGGGSRPSCSSNGGCPFMRLTWTEMYGEVVVLDAKALLRIAAVTGNGSIEATTAAVSRMLSSGRTSTPSPKAHIEASSSTCDPVSISQRAERSQPRGADSGRWLSRLELELCKRFPSPRMDAIVAAEVADPRQEQAAAVSATKRCIVRLLAAASPPHQLGFQQLGEALPRMLGGTRPARNLWLLCAEEPGVLQVVPQGERHYAVRLVCPTLLALAEERRRACGGSTSRQSRDPTPRDGWVPSECEMASRGVVRTVPKSVSAVPAAATATVATTATGTNDALEKALRARFPSPPEFSGLALCHIESNDWFEVPQRKQLLQAAAVAAAKRCVARLLAGCPPSHQIHMAQLGGQVPMALGHELSQHMGQTLRHVVSREPEVFELVPMGGAHVAVRLICPHLLSLAQRRDGGRSSSAAPANTILTTKPKTQAAGGAEADNEAADGNGIWERAWSGGEIESEDGATAIQSMRSASGTDRAMVPSGTVASNAAAMAAAVATAAATSAAVKAALARAIKGTVMGAPSARPPRHRQQRLSGDTPASTSGSQNQVDADCKRSARSSGSGGGGDPNGSVGALAKTPEVKPTHSDSTVSRQKGQMPLPLSPTPHQLEQPRHHDQKPQIRKQQVAAAATRSAASAHHANGDASSIHQLTEPKPTPPDGMPVPRIIHTPAPVSIHERVQTNVVAVAPDRCVVHGPTPSNTAKLALPSTQDRYSIPVPVPIPIPVKIPDANVPGTDKGTLKLGDELFEQWEQLRRADQTATAVDLRGRTDLIVTTVKSQLSGTVMHAPRAYASGYMSVEKSNSAVTGRSHTDATNSPEPNSPSPQGLEHLSPYARKTRRGSFGGSEGCRGSGGANEDAATRPLKSAFDSELCSRVCADSRLRSTAAQRALVTAAVIRCVARLLAASPPPHELLLPVLEDAVWHTVPLARRGEFNLIDVLAGEQSMFEVRAPDHGGVDRHPVVRLVCPILLRLLEVDGRQQMPPSPPSQQPSPTPPPSLPQQQQMRRGRTQQLQPQDGGPSTSDGAVQGCEAPITSAAEPDAVDSGSVERLLREMENGGAPSWGEDEGEGWSSIHLVPPSESGSPDQLMLSVLGISAVTESHAGLAPTGGDMWALPTKVPERSPRRTSETSAAASDRAALVPVHVPVPIPVPLPMPVPVPVPLSASECMLAPTHPVPERATSAHSSPCNEHTGMGAAVMASCAAEGDGLRGPEAFLPEVFAAPLPAPADTSRVRLPPTAEQPSQAIHQHLQQQQEAITADAYDSQPPLYGGSPAAGPQPPPPLPDTQVYLVHNPQTAEYAMMMEHCYSSPQLGLAVHYSVGVPAVVAVYAPPLVFVGGDGQELDFSYGMGFPAAVYLVDCTAGAAAAAAGVDGAAAAAALEEEAVMVGMVVEGLRELLESKRVQKVVYGGEQTLNALEAAIGATVDPVLDVRVLVDALLAMLPQLPPPPSAAALDVIVVTTRRAWTELETVGCAAQPPSHDEAEAAAAAQLNAHVGALRDALTATGLWSERPEYLGALIGRHFTALQDDLWAATGRDRSWLSRPLTEGQAAAAASAARHLPELWAVVAGEAVPWVAVSATAGRLEVLRAGRVAHAIQAMQV